MLILTQIIAALILFAVCFTLQALWLERQMRRAGAGAKRMMTLLPRAGRAGFMIAQVFGVLLPHFAALLLWALFYKFVAGGGEAVPLETALYFSASTHTGTAFGDITMTESWRILAALQALGGLIMLLWSAAYLIEVHTRLYRNAPAQIPHKDQRPAAKDKQ